MRRLGTTPQDRELILQSEGDINPKVFEQTKDDLRDLFRSAEDPIAVLLQTMETPEFKIVVSDEVANPVKERLVAMQGEHLEENDFIEQVIAITKPVLEIVKRGKKDVHKQEGRDMYTEADIEATIVIIKDSGAEKIYVTGNVGSGKTTFARELSRAVGYKNIDLDQWFQIFRQEQQREADNLKELLGYILQKEKPPFVINHSDLLKQDLINDADMVVFLNPNQEEQLKSRQIRTENGAEGDWQEVGASDYGNIAEQNIVKFDRLGGEARYANKKSGTIVRVLRRK